jgi:acyl-coenzyme A synthetase/AMP-(fatty) acid ligase
VPVAFIIALDPAPSETNIKAFIASSLSHYKQLHHVYFVDEIPKSPSGKILRRLLRQSLSK